MMASVVKRILNSEQGMLNSEVFVAPSTETYSDNANKNISDYVDSNGTVVAHYEYSPFGQITSTTGSLKNDFEYRFSSEYFDPETDLVYYNFRYYNPKLARWLSRDPIEEKGGLNLYVFVGNDGIGKWDLLGRKKCVPCNKCDKTGIWEVEVDNECTNVPDLWFTSPCQNHDACYATHGNSKSMCDFEFLRDMLNVCGIFDFTCKNVAYSYYLGVVVAGDSALAGDQRYSELQKNGTKCNCPRVEL